MIKPGDAFTGQFYIANIGNTDAEVVEAYFMLFLAKEPLAMERPYEGLVGNVAPFQARIAPGQSQTVMFNGHITTDHFKFGENVDWQTEGTLYALGWVEYVDGAKVRRRTTFCRPYTIGAYRFAIPDHPDPDYESEE